MLAKQISAIVFILGSLSSGYRAPMLIWIVKNNKKKHAYSGKWLLLQVGVNAPGTPKMTTFLPLNESVLKVWGMPQALDSSGS